MNKTALLHMVRHVSALSDQDVEELEKLVKNFPYCQTAHLLIAKASYDKGNMLSNQKLRKAAAYATNRQLLKKLIYTSDAVVSLSAIEHVAQELPDPETKTNAVIFEAVPEQPLTHTTASDLKNQEVKIEADPAEEIASVSSEIHDINHQENESTGNETAIDDSINQFIVDEIKVEPEYSEGGAILLPENLQEPIEEPLESVNVEDLQTEETRTIEPAELASEEVLPSVGFENEEVLSELEDLLQVSNLNRGAGNSNYTSDKNQPSFTELQEETPPAETHPEKSAPPAEIIRYELEVPEDFEEFPFDHTLARFDTYLFKPEKDELMSGELKPATPEEFYDEVYRQNHLGYWMGSSRLGELLQVKDELTTHTPLQFYPDLILEYSKQNYLTPTDPPKVSNVSRQLEIIDQFLKANPKLKSFSNEKMRSEPVDDLAFKSTKNSKHLASENLANIMVQQGKLKKAIKIYEHLIVKIPEKKAYFASQIEKLRNLV